MDPGGMSGIEPIETTDPEDAFAALADETRVAILRALWEADGQALSFSDLRDAVGMRDSGQFNYHLDKLTGRFVTETGEGYALTLAGRKINGAVDGGAYTMTGSFDPLEVPEACPSCGGDRRLRYEDETVTVECDSCAMHATAGVPPAVFAGYDRAEVPAVADRYFRTIYGQLAEGFCWYCEGRLDPSVVAGASLVDDPAVLDEYPEWYDELPLVAYRCRRCGADPVADLGTALADHPAVVSFYYDRGVDIRERPQWELVAWDPDRARIRERDPLRAAVTYTADGDDLTLVVDGDCEVVAAEGP
jgi:DNA-binding transcriptional ArsR family regulator